MKVKLNTNFTPYNQDTLVKPKSALWAIENNGTYVLIVNDIYYVYPKARFGVDVQKFLIPIIEYKLANHVKEEIEIVNETQFNVSFGESLSGFGFGLVDKKSFLLIETTVELK